MTSHIRFPESVLKKRLKEFQNKISDKGIDAVMLRTLSSFIYFTGIKWLRPALLIPSEDEPIAFIVKEEEEGFFNRTWIKNVITYTDGRDLMAKVSSIIRENRCKVVGMEFTIERDAYVLFYEMFKILNSNVKVVDIGQIIRNMRAIKDRYELEAMSRAGKIATKAMEKALSIIEEGISETDIAAEVYNVLYKLGSEGPHVYVNIGPNPRVHAEPFRDNIVRRGVFVTITIGADYNSYYANVSRTIFVGEPSNLAKRAMKCMDKVYTTAKEHTKSGVRLIDVMKYLDRIYQEYDLLNYRIIGYTHGVGLQVEEFPITTILPRDRLVKIQPNMVLALIHAPIMLKELGQVKKEDTFLVRADGSLEPVTYT